MAMAELDPAAQLVDLIGERSEIRSKQVTNRTKIAEQIDCLREQGWSYRRIGQVVGLSGQRIEQMHKGR